MIIEKETINKQTKETFKDLYKIKQIDFASIFFEPYVIKSGYSHFFSLRINGLIEKLKNKELKYISGGKEVVIYIFKKMYQGQDA